MEPTGAEPLRPDDPSSIGAYRLLGRLGEGGMGTVYLAVADDGRPVAVKVVKPRFAAEANFAARFHAEVGNARRVASFCTAQVLGNGNADDGRPYMVTEYIAGTPLSRQITRYGPLEAGPLHGLALGMAAALAAIHVAGLVHRDLKPANVILSLTGPRVIDFGIARALDATHSFTQSGELLGSPGWWAPEQVRGEAVTPATDVFAWGCVVAYAGSGRHPFGRGDVFTLAARVLNSRPALGRLPAPLDELARQATDPDPFRRPTAQDLLIALVSGAVTSPTTAGEVTEEAAALISGSWPARPNVTVDAPGRDAAGTPEETDATVPGAVLPPEAPKAPGGTTDLTTDLTADGTGSVAYERALPGRRSRGGRWVLAAAAVAAALGVTAAVLVATAGDGADPPRLAVEKAAAAGADIGRRIRIGGGNDVQLIVARPPVCGLPAYGGATARGGGLCVVSWTLLNLGGERAAVPAADLHLVDDRGVRHAPDKYSTAVPTAIAPGDRVDGVLIADLPAGRRPARLVLTEGGEARL